ncbi:MAG: hypothetical protein H8D78_11180 [Chloroflexi bacterium]|nr:hypothetical protein [Chloroflexota bacterium]
MTEPDFYASLIAHLVRAAPLESVLARRLLIDAGQGKLTPLIRQVRVELSKASRERGIERPPIVRGEPAARWDGLQLADMIAGALAEGERGGIEYLGAFGDKLTVLRYPEQRPP